MYSILFVLRVKNHKINKNFIISKITIILYLLPHLKTKKYLFINLLLTTKKIFKS